MTSPADLTFEPLDLDQLETVEGRMAIVVPADGKLDQASRRLNRLTRGAVERLVTSQAFEKMAQGDARELAWPTGLKVEAVQVVKLDQRPSVEHARKAGAAIGKSAGGKPVTAIIRNNRGLSDIVLGVLLRAYSFTAHKTGEDDAPGGAASLTVMTLKPDEAAEQAAAIPALAEGVFFTRDLVNTPSNVLTTTNFAEQLAELSSLGVKVEVLEEPDLERLKMGALLGVGQGSDSPSKVVVMEWNGAGDAQPFALLGKGVVFDTGGISLKPAAGMEDMTMDMGGAGVVAGTMKAIALRKAKANIVALVGLVENMPGPNAQRPGDVVTSMKGDTIEVINTDAEGRLVLADVMWYAQDRFKPRGMVDLATLTGAIIIGLGHENAGVFSNDDDLCDAFLKAARAEGEGAWRLPLGAAYDKQIKSSIADMKNVGGRSAGSITAAQFLKRFVKDDTPWIHLDIAGVASLKTDGPLSPAGATGWGVLALNRMIDHMFKD